MNKTEIQNLVREAINLGRIEVMDTLLPEGKWMTRPQVLLFLKAQGVKPGALKEWEKAGLLIAAQSGHGGTHKYRKLDVQRVILERTISDFKL